MVFSMILEDVDYDDNQYEDNVKKEYQYTDIENKNDVKYFYENLLESLQSYPLIFTLPMYPLKVAFLLWSK